MDRSSSPRSSADLKELFACAENAPSEMPLGWRVNQLCREFEMAFDAGLSPQLEDFLAREAPRNATAHRAVFIELLDVELTHYLERGEAIDIDAYIDRFPKEKAWVEQVFADVHGDLGDGCRLLFTEDRRFELGKEIARGGMGVILHAHDRQLNRPLAAKTILESHRRSPEARMRLLREAYIGSRLQHPGIVAVHGIGWTDHRPFFTMTLVEGETLSERLGRRSCPDSELPLFLRIFVDICQAVAYAHSKGTVHRDLKPANIMLGRHGEVLVMDWGLAKLMHGSTSGLRSVEPQSIAPSNNGYNAAQGPTTLAGRVFGTPHYMSPEQAQGQNHRVDYRTDVYSLGAILCEILTGRPVSNRGGEDGGPGEADLVTTIQRLDGCTDARPLVDLTKRCLATSPEDRPSHAGVLVGIVNDYLTQLEYRERDVEVRSIRRAAVGSQRQFFALGGVTAALIGLLFAQFPLAFPKSTFDRNDEPHPSASSPSTNEGPFSDRGGLAGDGWSRFKHSHQYGPMLSALRVHGPISVDELVALEPHLDLLVRLMDAERVDREIYSSQGPERSSRSADAYRSAFEGIDLHSDEPRRLMNLPRPASNLVLSCWIRWAQCATEEEQNTLDALIRRVDTDPVRIACRKVMRDELPQLLASRLESVSVEQVRQHPQAFVHQVAQYLRSRNQDAAAENLLDLARFAHPDAFLIHYDLARLATDKQPPQWEAASAHYAVAASIQATAGVYVRYAESLWRTGQKNSAHRAVERALFLDPTSVEAREAVGRWEASEQESHGIPPVLSLYREPSL